MNTHPSSCPHFPTCNANICPLDTDWRKRSHVAGDAACQVVMEHAKAGADAQFAARPIMSDIRPHAAALLADLRQEKIDRGGELRMGRGALLHAFEASAARGSSWAMHAAAGERLRAAREAKKKGVQM